VRAVRAVPAEPAEPDPAPVFVDLTGRRRRVVQHVVFLAGLLVAAYLSVMGLGLLAGSGAPLMPWPGHAPQGQDADAGGPGSTGKPTRGTPRVAVPLPTPLPGAARTAPTAGPSTSSSTPSPTATVSHPGNSHATPRGYGRTRSPNPKKTR
jgi:hypothetical protein